MVVLNLIFIRQRVRIGSLSDVYPIAAPE
jgi:hypothetical protein